MANTIGAVQEVNLELSKGAPLSFDAEWWDDAIPAAPINISAIDVRITLNGARYDLDLLGYATFSGNVVHVSLPRAWIDALPAVDGRWKLGATDAVSGEERLLARGSVKVRQ